jgi:membrane associated rhomboid family serine protease
MDRLLNRIERRFGRYALDNLTLVLVGTQIATLVLSTARPAFAGMLTLEPNLVRQGEIWRLFSYLFLPASFDPLWAIFSLYWLHMMGTALETRWGAFKYQAYWIVGGLLTALGAFSFDVSADNTYLLMSLFLAFATLWPRYEIRIFFILPVEVRWLALLDVLGLCAAIGMSDGWAMVLPVIAIGNYLLFFGSDLVALVRNTIRQGSRRRERRAFAAGPSLADRERCCAICGITSETDPDMGFRICRCAKHSGPTELCVTHARDH